jgi:DNA-binding GntR family transcriptional regulator
MATRMSKSSALDRAHMGDQAPSKTLADRLREQLSDEILRGALAPGIPLEEAELARRFDVSRTPVREAIRLLVASGLVEARPHRSAVVARATPSQLAAMFEALLELEALCAGLAAERMTVTERTELRRINAALLTVVRAVDPQRYHELNESFHSAIYAGCHNPYLERLTTETRTRISPFSRAQFRTLGRLARSHAEHEAVVRAILAGKRDAAASAMKAHIDRVHDAYTAYRGD